MEATALSVGKSVLSGALSYAKSALAEEVALQLGVRRDQLFITNELEMMQAFLEAAHDEGVDNMVVKVWVKQVRDVAYDVEDTLQEFAVRLEKQSWWRVHHTLLDRRRVANQMQELRANVEDVSQRNKRYNLIKGSGSKAKATSGQSSTSVAALFQLDEAAKQNKSKVDLVQLINDKENDLRVIAVWGTTTDLGQTSIIRAVYEDPDIKSKFPCRAWVRVMHPFVPKDFVQSLVEQFDPAVGVDALLETEKTARELADEFNGFVNKNRYLIVLTDLSTIEEWDRVKKCFPNNKMGSRILVSTGHVEVASLCVAQESIISELKQLSRHRNIYAFHDKVSQDAINLTQTKSTLNRSTTINDKSRVLSNEILEGQSQGRDGKNVIKRSLTSVRTMVAALEESRIVGREKEKDEIVRLVRSQVTPQFQVISVWGMGGLGKTTLVKEIYHNKLSGMFEKYACVTVMRPLSLLELLQSLVMQLDKEQSEKKEIMNLMGSPKSALLLLTPAELIKELSKLLERNKCLIVLDDVSSTAEWDIIKPIFHEMENTSRIVITTREEGIAIHCSVQRENIYMLEGLEYKDACKLFSKKVFEKTIELNKEYPELEKQAELILQKCKGLPLAIVTIGGFLAKQPKTTLEWRKLNEHISAELEMNPVFGTIKNVLMRSYDGLPFHLKSCFLYMPIFREDQKVRRGRLVRRWTAEGYSRQVRGKSEEEIADGYFLELISRSMILPSKISTHSIKGIDSCQVHDLMREIGISKSIEENLVFTLEEGCSSNSQATMRHLGINGNWKGDQSEFESIVDMSRVRSVTVFGDWKNFFISDKMSLLRVLDLENTTCLYNHHLKHIGKHLHLRFLSPRGCHGVYILPDSLGNLRELQTLDVRGTMVIKMPKSISNLEKLNYIYAGTIPADETISINPGEDAGVLRHRPCSLPLTFIISCVMLCAPQLFEMDGSERFQAFTFACCYLIPAMMMRRDMHGVLLPRGMQKLKGLHTLAVVSIAGRGKVILQDIKGLTRLCKLGLTGVSKENGQELCSVIVGLGRLESLSIRSEGEPGLSGCLDGMFSFPENLQKLKLYGYLAKLPQWLQGLKNLVTLKLRSTMLVDGMEILGKLRNLASLHLMEKSLQKGESHVSLKFPPAMFLTLVVLELRRVGDFNSVEFEGGAAPKLELLRFNSSVAKPKVGLFSGLRSLPSLKEFMLDDYKYEEDFMEELQAELGGNTNGPVLKMF